MWKTTGYIIDVCKKIEDTNQNASGSEWMEPVPVSKEQYKRIKKILEEE